jgi:hypothetical protein
MIFCTLFNARYLPQGLSLYHSLERVIDADFVLYVLCMDDFTYGVLAELDLPSLRLIALREVEDEKLQAVRKTRTVAEYCWTCTTPLLLYVFEHCPSGSVVTYVDADLFFFSDPRGGLDELGDKSILVHEHDFAPEYAHLATNSGRFNVGLVSFRDNDEARECLERWKEQCLDECTLDPCQGKCGDQNYLDEWPARYPGLVITSNPGIGLAPWNVSKHTLRGDWRGTIMVDDDFPLIFYHFHSMRPLRPRFGVNPVLMAQGQYRISPEVAGLIYNPYVAAIYEGAQETNQTLQIQRLGHRLTREMPTLPQIYCGAGNVANRQFLFVAGPFSVPLERNPQVINALYGMDPHRDEM